ncbi:MAG: pckA [Candidatus Brocadiaceae bacterium]|nr:pckA [Candidatus Brocadiaceae bacterium]
MSLSTSSSMKEFEVANRIVKYFSGAPNVINSTDWTLRRNAERFASFTKFGNVSIHSTVKNRSAKVTVYVGSDAVRLKTLNPQQTEITNNLLRPWLDGRRWLPRHLSVLGIKQIVFSQ